MKIQSQLCGLAALAAACMIGGVAHAQQQDTTAPQARETGSAPPKGELAGIEPVAPVGPPVVTPAGAAVVPVAPVETFEGVETVTLQTERGPVVVISYPGTVPAADYNIDFSALDADRDGYITRAEAGVGRNQAAQGLKREFDAADTSGDGKLAFTEVLEWVY